MNKVAVEITEVLIVELFQIRFAKNLKQQDGNITEREFGRLYLQTCPYHLVIISDA